MKRHIPKCGQCGEDTTHNRDSSLHGHVHRYGPRDHPFVRVGPPWEAAVLTAAAFVRDEWRTLLFFAIVLGMMFLV